MTGLQHHLSPQGGWRESYQDAVALVRAGRPDAAAQALDQALRLTGGEGEASAQVHAAYAALERRRGSFPAALAHLEAACRAAPASGVAALEHGAALADVGRLTDAVEAFQRAGRLHPTQPHWRSALALALIRLHRAGEAELVAREGLSAHPCEPRLLKALAAALQAQGRMREAATCLERAVAGGDSDALYDLGVALKADGRPQQAIEVWDYLLERDPHHAPARMARVMAELRDFYADEAEVAASRSAYARALRALADWAARQPPGALAKGVGAAQPFDLPYQGGGWAQPGEDDLSLQTLYGSLVVEAMSASYPPIPLAAPPRSGERLRIGVVSGFFRHHANWRIPVRGWVEGLDRRRVQLFGYHTRSEVDAVTDVAAALFERFVQGPLSTEGWRSEIAADRPHVLIYPEVGMDPMAARLAAQRLAPVQCGSWGHPVTTGLPTLDLYLSSDLMEPPTAEANYSERLVRLPGLSTPVRPDPLPPRADRGRLGWSPQAVVFWCAQSPYKHLPRFDDLYARIATRVPNACFVFTAYPDSETLTERFRQRLHRAFAARKVDADAACVILPRLAPEDFLAAMGAADVALDSPAWSGCNSLLDALAWRLPVVTLPGDTMRSRHGSALLQSLDMTGLPARNADEYVEQAVMLASSPTRRAGCEDRRPLSSLASPHSSETVRALEAALQLAVDNWSFSLR